MGIGLQVFNDQNTLQFDSESPAYAFVGKGTVQTGDSGPPDAYNSWSLAFVDNLPTFDTIAVSCRTGAVIAGGIGIGESTSAAFSATAGSHVITYYLFRSYNKLPSISGAGFESFTSGGQLSYSTAYRPLAVVARQPITNMYPNMSEGYGLAGGREYAFCQYGSMQRDIGNGTGGGGGYDVPTITFNGANAAVRTTDGGFVVEEVRGNGFYWGNPTRGGFLAVDVTGL